jgi:citrate lyase subunit beta / citryl-CoA lyase
MLKRSRRFGFEGGTCVHPSQVPALNAAFGVSDADAAEASELIRAYEMARAAGRGAVRFQGRMVDLPMVERAHRVIERAAAASHSRIEPAQPSTPTQHPS